MCAHSPPPNHLRKRTLVSFSPETTIAAGAVICLLSERQNKPKVMNGRAGRRGRVYRLTAIVWGPPIYFTHLPMEVTRFVLTKKSRMKLSSLCHSPTTDNTFVTQRPPLLLEGVLKFMLFHLSGARECVNLLSAQTGSHERKLLCQASRRTAASLKQIKRSPQNAKFN